MITRIACYEARLGQTPQQAVENLMHIMDASSGKQKMIKSSRKSTAVRHFNYSSINN